MMMYQAKIGDELKRDGLTCSSLMAAERQLKFTITIMLTTDMTMCNSLELFTMLLCSPLNSTFFFLCVRG